MHIGLEANERFKIKSAHPAHFTYRSSKKPPHHPTTNTILIHSYSYSHTHTHTYTHSHSHTKLFAILAQNTRPTLKSNKRALILLALFAI
jgi:hypothetical protein